MDLKFVEVPFSGANSYIFTPAMLHLWSLAVLKALLNKIKTE